MHRLTDVRASRARRAAWFAAALLTLLAVFAMHGPSSDHAMLVPMGATGHQHLSAGVHMSSAGADQPVATPSESATMHHTDCVGTLRQDAQSSPPAEAVATQPEQAPAVRRVVSTGATLRGPPPPSLERLCISRT